ncbi:uncharacterized protein A1O9_08644 [Exophiala aquamarina CBS 119918]|uniref:Xylanolytic transcriptional activator regulatory domain-containing protein n=1 Tax=Exophiala aquamarina CBS 119918 TaxID=1182545 RepID=A0A072P5J2_9EURO|nr:uncharacterized protein A1O9_08644 [Exophiala aquamarina CBS 119918]KEF54992.1 hypothetical protein A1O9_08644 [Exophiala aquamarina CBS 119918]
MSSDQTIGGENYVDSSVGSPGHQDLLTQSIDIDLGRGTVGFIGKVSEISWITRAYSYLVSLDHEHPDGHANTSQRNSGTQLGYFMDDENLLSIDEDYVNALHWPGDMAVYILSEAFFHALQGIFDSFAREIFLEELRDFPRHQASFSWDQRRWLALTNLIWAIGSKWLHQAMLKDDLGIENHLVYYARARALGLDHRVMLDSQNFYGVKALGMLSFYLFINGSVNRAWALVGLAIRNATSLGLHLKVADGTSSPTQLIERARLWYSLYSLEVAMSEVFGKPPSISLAYTTVPVMLLQGSVHKDHHADNTSSRSLWLDFLRRTRPIIQTMSGGQMSWQIFQFIGYGAPRHHLSYRTRLSMISNQIMTQLYMPNQSNSWASVQKKIANLDIQLLDWHKSLPDDLDLESTVPSGTDPRAKIELALHYQSVRMILHRPCLCHIQILAESTFSRDFNYSNARSCVYGAVALVNILPDNPTRHEAYQLLPWWNLLHYLGQALAVFILELCLDMEHFEQSSTLFKPHIQKAMTYLECLTTGSLSAYKAWRILRQMLMALSFRVDDFDIANIALDAQVPAGWTDVDEATLMEALGSIGEVGS